jgi:glutathione S-transferase
MTARLYVTPASHPCATAERALQLKQLPYRRVVMIPVAHRLAQQARFGAGTVPGIVFGDGEHVIGTRPIVRALEARAPSPPLLPADGERRAAVERAEEWGDQVLQALARRVIWAALRRAPDAIPSYLEGSKLPVPDGFSRLSSPLVARMAATLMEATDPVVRADLIALRATHLPRVERWIKEGVLGGGAANAADLQIGSSLRILLTIEDVAPLLKGRLVEGLARRWFPAYPGVVPAGTLPAAWVTSP